MSYIIKITCIHDSLIMSLLVIKGYGVVFAILRFNMWFLNGSETCFHDNDFKNIEVPDVITRHFI